MARDYYGILGVDKDASDADLKRAHRKLALKYHPDRNPDDEQAAEKFREATEAYQVLSDPEKRRIVDMGGDPMETRSGMPGGGFGGFQTGDLGDIFSQFFGGGGGRGGTRKRSRVQPGADALLNLKLDLEECYTGVRKTVTVDTAVLCDVCAGSGSQSKAKPVTCQTCEGTGEVRQLQQSFLGQMVTSMPCGTCDGTGEVIPDPCSNCAGDGRVRSRRDLTVNVPAGIADGMRIRMAGQGQVGPGGGPAGDLYVEVYTEPHKVFRREADNLHISVDVPMVDAALGTTVTVTDLVGEQFEVEIAAGTQPEQEIRVGGKGMPRLRKEGHGDLIAHVNVTVPGKLDGKSRDLLEKLREHRHEKATVVDGTASRGFFSRFRNRR